MSSSSTDLQPAFFTICARRQAAHAACLGESLAAHHPGAKFTIWLLDDAELPGQAVVTGTRGVRDVLAEAEYVLFRLKMSASAFASAVIPQVFQIHFAEGDQRAIYLAPEVYLLGQLTEAVAPPEPGSVGWLAPRTERFTSDDHLTPDGGKMTLESLADACLIALESGPETSELLVSWAKQVRNGLLDQASAQPRGPIGEDPRPGILARLSIASLSFKSAQLSRFNKNTLIQVGGGWKLDSEPLKFVDFDGFNPSTGPGFSPQGSEANGALAALVSSYRERLFAHGWDSTRALPFGKPAFADGARFDRVAIAALAGAYEKGISFTSVCGLGPGTFRSHLWNGQGSGSRGEYVAKLLEMRPDLVAAFESASASSITQWVSTHGARELRLEPRLLEEPSGDAITHDVVFVGYFSAELGLGQAARNHVAALRSVGIEPRLVDVSLKTASPIRTEALPGECLTELPPSEVTIFELNPDKLSEVMRHLKIASDTPRNYRIGYWAWETMELPSGWELFFADFDEIWCGTEFVARAAAARSPIPVVTVPYCVDVPEVAADKSAFGLTDDEFVFLFSFDFYGVAERKNPLGTIAAFTMAFTPDEPVRLLIKSLNAPYRPEIFDEMKRAAAGLRVTFLDGPIDSASQYKLIASCDAYVSLHRAEGFGYGMAEAMAYGKPVIATGWSGNLEFMTHWNSYPVEFELERLEQDAGPYPADTPWAVPNLEDAAEKMRFVWKHPSEVAKVARRAKNDVSRGFGPEAVGLQMKQRLEVVAQIRANRPLLTSPSVRPSQRGSSLSRLWNALRREGPLGLLRRRVLR